MPFEEAMELLYRQWERLDERVEKLRGDLADLEKAHRKAIEAYDEGKSVILNRIRDNEDRAAELRSAMNALGGVD